MSPWSKPGYFMNRLLRPRIWPSSRASSGVEPCDVPFRYASGPKPCGCPVAHPSPRSRDCNSWNIRAMSLQSSGQLSLGIAHLAFRMCSIKSQKPRDRGWKAAPTGQSYRYVLFSLCSLSSVVCRLSYALPLGNWIITISLIYNASPGLWPCLFLNSLSPRLLCCKICID